MLIVRRLLKQNFEGLSTMVMQSLRNGTSGGFLKYILLGILAMSVGGLVMMDVTGVFNTGGISESDVAKVEDKSITIQEFDRSLRRSLARYNLSVEQAYGLGLVNELLSNQIRSLYLQLDAEEMGIKFDKNHLAKRIAEVVKPQMNEGETMQQALDRMLSYQRMPEREFVKSVEQEATANIIMDAISEAIAPKSELLAETLYQFQKQTRDIEFIVFANQEIKGIEPPSEQQIQAIYDAIKEHNYKTPEYRRADVIVFDPEYFDQTVEVKEDEIKAYYKTNKDMYMVGERYFITQILTDKKDVADEIFKEVQTGKSLKEVVATPLGENVKYIENVPFETSMMLPEFYKALKSLKSGEFAPPFKSMLGHHVTKLIEIRDPEILPYEDVKTKIKNDLATEKKHDMLYDTMSTIDLELSDGLDFSDATEKYEGATVVRIEFIDVNGEDENENRPADEHFDIKDAMLLVEALFENEDETPSPLIELDDRRFISVKMTEKRDAGYIPLEDVRDEVITRYENDIKKAENENLVRKLVAESELGTTTLKDLSKQNNKALQSLYEISLENEIGAPLIQENIPVIFKSLPDELNMLEVEDGYVLFNVTNFTIPEISDASRPEISDIQTSLDEEYKEEAFLLYLGMLNNKYDATVNQPLLDRLYAPKGNGN